MAITAPTQGLGIASAQRSGLMSHTLRYVKRGGLARLSEVTEHLGAIDNKIGIYPDRLEASGFTDAEIREGRS